MSRDDCHARRSTVVSLISLWTALLLSVGSASQQQSKKPAHLIPLTKLLNGAQFMRPRVSPDGRYIAYLWFNHGKTQLRLMNIDRWKDEDAIDIDASGITSYRWSPDSKSLFFFEQISSDEQYRLYELRIASEKLYRWTPRPEDRAGPAQWMADGILLMLKLRGRNRFDAFRLDLKTRTLRLLMKNPGNVLRFFADEEWRIRAVTVFAAAGRRKLLVRTADGAPWTTVRQWSSGERGLALGLVCGGRHLLFLDDSRTSTRNLSRYDMKSGRVQVLYSHALADLPGDLLLTKNGCHVEAVATEYLRYKWVALDRRTRRDFERLQKISRGQPWRQIQRSRDRRYWVVTIASDRVPGYLFLYDRASGKTRFLYQEDKHFADYKRAEMKPVIIRARDGLRLVSYLTVPLGVKPKKLPMVLLVHGGPWVRDRWRFNYTVQFLASRGYAVLQVNYRGSAGFGRGFFKAGFRELGRGMQRDLWDAVRWTIRRGIADPKRIAIMGGSFGGFSTLAGLAFAPQLFAAGIAFSSATSLITLQQRAKQLIDGGQWMMTAVGHPKRDAQLLFRQSPVHHASTIRAPLLMFHGSKDMRVPLSESQQMVKALRSLGKRLTFVVYPHEGHGFRHASHLIDFYRRIELFLHKHLGGHRERKGQDQLAKGVVVHP